MKLALNGARIHAQAIVAASTLIFATHPARARPPAPPPIGEAAAGIEAQRLFDEGRKAMDRKEWTAAQERFQASLTLKPHWKTAANLGQAEFELKQYRQCAEHTSLAMRNAPNNETKAKIQTLLDLCTAQLGTVRITINQAGSTVWVDGKEVGVAPILDLIFVEAGPHKLTAGQGKNITIQREFTASRGNTTHIDLIVAVPEPLAAPPVLQPRVEQPKTSEESAIWRKAALPVAIGTGALGLLGLGLGIGYGVKAADQVKLVKEVGEQLEYRYEQGEIPCVSLIRPGTEPLCAQDAGARDSFGTYRAVEIIGFATAGAAALAEVFIALQWPSKTPSPKIDEKTSALRVAPSLGKEQNGIIVYGSF